MNRSERSSWLYSDFGLKHRDKQSKTICKTKIIKKCKREAYISNSNQMEYTGKKYLIPFPLKQNWLKIICAAVVSTKHHCITEKDCNNNVK